VTEFVTTLITVYQAILCEKLSVYDRN